MAFPIKICSVCSEEFELKPDKPGFANRCPECTDQDAAQPAAGGKAKAGPPSDRHLDQARKEAMRNLLYRKDS